MQRPLSIAASTFFTLATAACTPNPEAVPPLSNYVQSQQCQKDTDCKGDRICESGVCASPAENTNPSGKSASSDKVAADIVRATELALKDQLDCRSNPSPGAAIRAMLKNGLLVETDNGADGIPVFATTRPLFVYGKPITYVAGWQFEKDGSVKQPFYRGPGTSPPHHIAVSFADSVSAIDYTPHMVREADGMLRHPFSSIEKGSLDFSDEGSTITCYGDHF